MASISRLMFWSHLRAEPNEHIVHFRHGRIVRRGPGLSYWFNPLTAAIAMVPVEDCETTFVLKERTSDFQEVAVQITVTYRFAEVEKCVSRANFTLSLQTGRWTESPLDRLAGLWSQAARPPTRAYLGTVTVDQAMRSGADAIRNAVVAALKEDAELRAMGFALVAVQIAHVAPTPEVQKALETPTREAIQQKADEAVFQRRALAVEKERAIKENELATEIELTRKNEQLLKQQGANKLAEVRMQAESEQARVKAEAERQELAAQAYARDTQVRAAGDAQSRRSLGEAEADVQAKMLEQWKNLAPETLAALALRDLAGKIESVHHLNITPEILGEGFKRLLQRTSEKS